MLRRRLRNLMHAIRQWGQVPSFGFIQGHGHLSDADLLEIGRLVGEEDAELISEFENGFAGLIGEGHAVSFAAGRMGFYALMKACGINEGDEVVLQGGTCSVMVNAVLRIGAAPIYADVDPETFGSSAARISKVLTARTRMIVAQHSFGIPCDIRPIADLARERDIFLVEDCALTVGSSVDGIVCGNFGNAALFSTDHSKPINTVSGGMIYTNSRELHGRLKAIQSDCASLSKKRQQALWHQLLYEREYCSPERYGKTRLLNMFRSLSGATKPSFLDEDFGTAFSSGYPYPALMPAFLAAIGMKEILRWEETREIRKAILNELLELFDQYGVRMPAVYRDPSRDIVPLRLAWSSEDAEHVRNRLAHILHISWIWFMQPVIATSEPLENFGYLAGQCPISETIGPRMINIPCTISREWAESLKESINACLEGY